MGKGMHHPRPTVLELTEAGKWMEAPALVQVTDSAKEDVVTAVMTTGMSPDNARDLHDVVMACTMFGHLPPMRPMCLCSILHPDYKGACLYPECKRQGCLGNKLVIITKDPLKMHLQLPHHKNEGSWNSEVIHFDIPDELAQLMFLWAEGGHQDVCDHLLLLEDPPCPFLFMNTRGKGLTTKVFGKWWRAWVKDHGGAVQLPPSKTRHIFVDERTSEDCVPGPSNKGAAMAMGNSLATWDRHYNLQKHFHAKEAQAAVSAMTTWRKHMLDKAAANASSGE